MDTAFRHLHMPSDLACEFLVVFARMEYALKATRFAFRNRNDIFASWDRFANEAHERFHAETSEELKAAVDFLWDFPPRKQFLADDERVRFRDFEIDPAQRQLQ
ncbi:hypothetical protein MSP8886_04276 [Marinomonas spartinae]|uniref:Uncharacterized protein n=1 Tax=Marinomonas spartinae TaxID=1792290 RepID=A0A1A8TWC0_9GAMM|nr:hypothetical protein [Marinomonas spartinae]SBS37821.1 hypothetical protein MSP8886_04276 [Marinomonas spartinae]